MTNLWFDGFSNFLLTILIIRMIIKWILRFIIDELLYYLYFALNLPT